MNSITNNYHNKLFVNLIKKYVIPNLSSSNRKYNNGLNAFIGSSSEFTGGIYISAITAMKVGADQSHIFAHNDSVLALKSYSPEVIIHNSFSSKVDSFLLKDKAKWTKNFNSIVYGVCLGKEDYAAEVITTFLSESKKHNNVHIFDADSIYFFTKYEKRNVLYNLIKETNSIFTPNYKEFNYIVERYKKDKPELCLKFKDNKFYEELEIYNYKNKTLNDNNNNNNNNNNDNIEIIDLNNEILSSENIYYREVIIARDLNQIIFKKSLIDIITDGKIVALVKTEGSLKRCGGIGDILDGVLSGFTSMSNSNNSNVINKNYLVYTCICASHFVKHSSYLAYKNKGLSMTSLDVLYVIKNNPIDKIIESFKEVNN